MLRYGIPVLQLQYSSNYSSVLENICPDVVLAAKPPLHEVLNMKQALSDAGCSGALWALWTWDLIDYGDDGIRREWFESVAPLMDVVFLNEVGRQGMWEKGLNVQMQHVVDGTVSISSDSEDGGVGDSIGLRPCWARRGGGGGGGEGGIVFVGSPGSSNTKLQSSGRIALLKRLSQTSIPIEIYGPEDEWLANGFESLGVIGGSELCGVYRGAAAVIAMSRDLRTGSSQSAAAVGMYR
jgi:hypothetical protein